MTATTTWITKNAVLVGFAWGLAEATLFFIVPDVAVAFIALVAPRAGWKAAGASIVGTMLGAAVMFAAVVLWLHQDIRDVLTAIPGINHSTLAAARHRIATSGAAALLPAAFSGIPYKVYAAELTLAGYGLPAILLWTIPSRALRLVPVAAGAGTAGVLFEVALRRYRRVWIPAYVLAWALSYGWYWSRPAL